MDSDQAFDQKSSGEIVGFNWDLKIVLGSSSSSNLQQKLVGVDFYVQNNEQNNLQPNTKFGRFSLEMNETELNNLIGVLEKAVGS
ncbi:hypothetical protein LSTR_LSTR011400 [Laodelphax striatellus]|uniref:COMM domain-containing protein n=1 Tax=Laodelphax striatellus TaxID=195883 RepID=A0A482XUQ8_LAOST|nr:hypothetical protein LSTR_LSTR011400 [Laodelphax striatellus]